MKRDLARGIVGAVFALVLGCGSPGATGPTPAATEHGPGRATVTPTPKLADAGAAASAPATAAGPTVKGPVVLTQLSTSDPDCGLDAEGRVYRFTNGKIERDAASLKGVKM